MYNSSISKRTFFKNIGFLVILGMIAPWFKRSSKVNVIQDLPMKVYKEPNAISRGNNLI